MKFIKAIFNNDIVKRCVKTFIQAFCASLVISLKGLTDVNETIVKSILIGAISSGICAVMNLIIQYLDNKKGN